MHTNNTPHSYKYNSTWKCCICVCTLTWGGIFQPVACWSHPLVKVWGWFLECPPPRISNLADDGVVASLLGELVAWRGVVEGKFLSHQSVLKAFHLFKLISNVIWSGESRHPRSERPAGHDSPRFPGGLWQRAEMEGPAIAMAVLRNGGPWWMWTRFMLLLLIKDFSFSKRTLMREI